MHHRARVGSFSLQVYFWLPLCTSTARATALLPGFFLGFFSDLPPDSVLAGAQMNKPVETEHNNLLIDSVHYMFVAAVQSLGLVELSYLANSAQPVARSRAGLAQWNQPWFLCWIERPLGTSV
jgi:hypothetical protein